MGPPDHDRRIGFYLGDGVTGTSRHARVQSLTPHPLAITFVVFLHHRTHSTPTIPRILPISALHPGGIGAITWKLEWLSHPGIALEGNGPAPGVSEYALVPSGCVIRLSVPLIKLLSLGMQLPLIISVAPNTRYSGPPRLLPQIRFCLCLPKHSILLFRTHPLDTHLFSR